MGGGVSTKEIAHLRERERGLVIGICTSDFSTLLDLVEVLRERGIGFALLAPGEEWEKNIDCLVLEIGGRPPSFPLGPPPTVEPLSDADDTIDRAVAAAMGLARPRSLLVGVDPGLRPGVAFFLDGRLVAIRKAVGPKELIKLILKKKKAFSPKSILVRVGNGDPERRDSITALLLAERIRYELVDERCTSRTKKMRDEVAAISIGLGANSP